MNFVFSVLYLSADLPSVSLLLRKLPFHLALSIVRMGPLVVLLIYFMSARMEPPLLLNSSQERSTFLRVWLTSEFFGLSARCLTHP